MYNTRKQTANLLRVQLQNNKTIYTIVLRWVPSRHFYG